MGNETSNNNSNQNAITNSNNNNVVANQQAAPQQQNTVSNLKSNVGAALHKGWKKSKAAGQKAIAHSKRLAARTDNIPELLILANEELTNHIQIRNETNLKLDKTNKYFDSIRNPTGIIFVTGWSVGLGTFGGSYRRGIMIHRLDNGDWSLPYAIQEFEGSAGLQLKATTDAIWYIIKNKEEMKAFTDSNNIKLGAGAQLALGSAGLTTQADLTLSKESATTNEDIEEKASTNASVGSAKGFAIGAAFHGGTFQGYKKANESFYCRGAKKLEILNTGMSTIEAFNLLAGHPNMPEIKKNNLAILAQFVNTLNQLIKIENQKEGQVVAFAGPNHNNTN